MTDQTNPLTPKQADREAAAALGEALAGRSNGRDQIAECRAGRQDHTFPVQAFAHHAQQARLEERERILAIVKSKPMRFAGLTEAAVRDQIARAIA